jgi:hypothetical protein
MSRKLRPRCSGCNFRRKLLRRDNGQQACLSCIRHERELALRAKLAAELHHVAK